MPKGVTITRDKNATIPLDYLAKAYAENKSGVSFVLAKDNGVRVIVRKDLKANAKVADEFQRSDGLKDVPIVLHFANSSENLTEEELQPFTLLQNADDSLALVCFLDGDFSAYGGEAECVEKAIIPRIDKLVNMTDGDIDKIMSALDDDITMQDWANFMLGARGSITLVAHNGRMITICVDGDETQKSFDGWWTSNYYGYGDTVAQSVAAEVNESKPKLKLPVGIPGKKRPIASTTPISTSVPGTGPQPEAAPVSKPSVPTTQPTTTPDLGDPETVLTINIPSGMDLQRATKWIRKRMPEGLMPNTISGLKALKLKRKDANPQFIQTFLEQNKLGALGVLKNGTAPAPQAVAVPPKEAEFPAPVVEPSKPQEGPAVVGEPLPVLSPRQIEETVNFINDPSIKLVIDAHGKVIATPHGLEQMESRVDSLSKQFGGKVNILDMAKWPLDVCLRYAKHDANAAGIIMFCLATELQKSYKLMDGLTAPKPEEAAPSAQPAAAPAQGLPPGVPRKRKVA